MLTIRRPSNSRAARRFANTYLRPVFGNPDAQGNYHLKVGTGGNVLFAAHYDTVHYQGGTQAVTVEKGFARLSKKSKSNCLGADCTSGIWLILRMIEAGVEGSYAVFADEEIGCVGSRDFALSPGDRLDGIEAVLSFDRRGYDSIITHQCGLRTASDRFALTLAAILDMPDLKPDPTGSFTDSNEFPDFVGECSNLSVGYFGAHTSEETQDLGFLASLADRLIAADWSKLEFDRRPGEFDPMPRVKKSKGKKRLAFDDYSYYGGNFGRDPYSRSNYEELRRLVRDYPDAVAAMLEDMGVDSRDLSDYTGDRYDEIPF